MYLIDTQSRKVVGAQTHSSMEQTVVYNESLNRAVKKHKPYTLISIHNHPESKPPSGSDLSSCFMRKYKKGIIVCHNGDIYTYVTSLKPLPANLFDMTVDKYKKLHYNKGETYAYEMALKQFEQSHGIKWEVR